MAGNRLRRDHVRRIAQLSNPAAALSACPTGSIPNALPPATKHPFPDAYSSSAPSITCRISPASTGSSGEVWPLLPESFSLHVIAGARHEYFQEFYRDRVSIDLAQPRISVEGFVADVRPAYRQASRALAAPLVSSAGTNIKVLEAMAMGKAVVATPAGINGLVLSQEEVGVAASGQDFAQTLIDLESDSSRRKTQWSSAARKAAEARFTWQHYWPAASPTLRGTRRVRYSIR
jgi:hypothetical protein